MVLSTNDVFSLSLAHDQPRRSSSHTRTPSLPRRSSCPQRYPWRRKPIQSKGALFFCILCVIVITESISTRSENHVFLPAACGRHLFLLDLHSCFQTETRIYFTMEYVSGGDLMLYFQCKQFSLGQARFHASEVLLVFDYFRANGIIHQFMLWLPPYYCYTYVFLVVILNYPPDFEQTCESGWLWTVQREYVVRFNYKYLLWAYARIHGASGESKHTIEFA